MACTMTVKMNNISMKPHTLVGGGPQGTLLGQIQYIVASNDCAVDDVTKENRLKLGGVELGLVRLCWIGFGWVIIS